MEIIYLTDFEVKYKTIENELKEKIKSRTVETDEDYTIEDVEDICDEIYKREIMSVFRLNTMDYGKIYEATNQLLELINKNADVSMIFQMILEKMRAKKFMNIELKEELIFSTMFCYELFHYMHDFLNLFLKEQKLDETVIENMLVEIEKI